MKRKRLVFVFGLVLLPIAIVAWTVARNYNTYHADNQYITSAISHESWDKLLKKYVNESGGVDYMGFIGDSIELNRYLHHLSANPPATIWTESEQLSYWINAYNAFTVQLILRNYPLQSIKDIGSKIQIPFINSPWDIDFISIGDDQLTLNNIEHQILRKQFEEPRIHFAIVCASISCPMLRNEAYEAGKIDGQLEEQAIEFINNPSKNILTRDRIELTRIFQWFKGDFTESGTLIEFINKYAKQPIDLKAKIKYMDYDWGLNDGSKDL